jgi:hypothetical protein
VKAASASLSSSVVWLSIVHPRGIELLPRRGLGQDRHGREDHVMPTGYAAPWPSYTPGDGLRVTLAEAVRGVRPLRELHRSAARMSDDDRLRVASHPGLERIADFCQVGITRTGVDAMSVTFANSFAGLEVLLATDELAERVAQLEFTVGEGPGVDALASRLPSMADDLATGVSARRWPVFAAEAVQVGARAVQAYPIVFSRRAFGTVGLYSRAPRRLSSEQHRHAEDITELIGLTLVDPRSGASVGSGLRMTVHQAAGMVMQQTGRSIQDALVLLRSTAYDEDVKVTDLAADVIAGRRNFGEAEKADG